MEEDADADADVGEQKKRRLVRDETRRESYGDAHI